MTARPRAFSNGSEYMDWQWLNCERCSKADWKSPVDEMPCQIQAALSIGAFTDGTVSDEIFRRMGERSRKCTEFEPAPSTTPTTQNEEPDDD